MGVKILNELLRLKDKKSSKGFIFLPRLLESGQIDLIKDEFLFFRNECLEFESDIRLFRQEALKATDRILRPKVKNMFKQHLNLGSLYTHKWMVNEITNSSTGSGGGWHRDTSRLSQFKIITYLNDCNESQGPFQYLNTMNTDFTDVEYLQTKTRLTESDIELLLEKGALIETITGKAGDAFLVNTQHIHRGKPPMEIGRLAVTSYSYPLGLIPKNIRLLL